MDHKTIQNGKFISEGPVYKFEVCGKVFEGGSVEAIAEKIVKDEEMAVKLNLSDDYDRNWSFVNSNLWIVL